MYPDKLMLDGVKIHSYGRHRSDNMSKKLDYYAPLLRKLKRASPSVQKRMLSKCCDRDFINCISECCKNVLNGNVKLTSSQLSGIRQRKKTLRKLAAKKTSLIKKRKLIQKGGFLGALLGPIVSVLSGLFMK